MVDGSASGFTQYVLAKRTMHASPGAIGLLLGLGAAVGTVGSLLAPAIGRRIRYESPKA